MYYDVCISIIIGCSLSVPAGWRLPIYDFIAVRAECAATKFEPDVSIVARLSRLATSCRLSPLFLACRYLFTDTRGDTARKRSP